MTNGFDACRLLKVYEYAFHRHNSKLSAMQAVVDEITKQQPGDTFLLMGEQVKIVRVIKEKEMTDRTIPDFIRVMVNQTINIDGVTIEEYKYPGKDFYIHYKNSGAINITFTPGKFE